MPTPFKVSSPLPLEALVSELIETNSRNLNQNSWQGWAVRYKSKVIQVSDEVIAHIKAALIDTMGWVEEEGLRNAWKTMFPLTQESRMTGYLDPDQDPDHLA